MLIHFLNYLLQLVTKYFTYYFSTFPLTHYNLCFLFFLFQFSIIQLCLIFIINLIAIIILFNQNHNLLMHFFYLRFLIIIPYSFSNHLFLLLLFQLFHLIRFLNFLIFFPYHLNFLIVPFFRLHINLLMHSFLLLNQLLIFLFLLFYLFIKLRLHLNH